MIHRGLIIFALLPLACGGVSSSLDTKSEGDQVRDQALALFLDRTMTDSADGSDGDNTDWKYIDVVEKGGLRVEIGLDSPEKLEGADLTLYDEFGKRLDRRLIMPNQTSYSFEREVEKIPTKFYVRMFTKSGKSVYSVGARLSPEPKPAGPKVVYREPVQPTQVEPEPVSCPRGMVSSRGRCVCPRGYAQSRGRCVKKRIRATPTPKVPVAAPATRAPRVVTPVATAKRVVGGKVVRVVPSEDGSAVSISMRLNGEGVRGGNKGTLFKNGARVAGFTVGKARGKSARARVRASSAELTSGSAKLTVKITVD